RYRMAWRAQWSGSAPTSIASKLRKTTAPPPFVAFSRGCPFRRSIGYNPRHLPGGVDVRSHLVRRPLPKNSVELLHKELRVLIASFVSSNLATSVSRSILRRLILPTVLLTSIISHAAISFVQQNNAVPQTPQATVSVTFTAAQVAGDTNVVAVG